MDFSINGRRRRSSIAPKDRLSNLPNCLKEHILTFLPLRDAARTCVLSTAWSHTWENRSSLAFDSDFTHHYTLHGGDWDKWLLAVHKAMRSRRGPLKEFSLFAPFALRGLSIGKIHQIFRVLNDIESLHVEIFNYRITKRHFASLAKLKELSLCNVMLPQTSKNQLSFEGFRVLTVIVFNSVAIRGQPDSVLFKCPMLSALTLDSFGHNVKYLFEILIEAPQLVFFHFVGEVATLWLKSTPLLGNVKLTPLDSCTGELERFNKVFGGLSMVESLTVSVSIYCYLVKHIEKGYSCSAFLKLNYLKMSYLCLNRRDCIRSATFLIKLCPNLKTLIIKMNCFGLYPKEPNDGTTASSELRRIMKELDDQKYKLMLLEKVEISEFTGTETEMAFIGILLAISPSLQRMELNLLTSGDLSVDINKVLFVAELFEFPRASTSATISMKALKRNDTHSTCPCK